MAAPILGYLEPFDPKTTTWESWYERLPSFFVANGTKAEENERRVDPQKKVQQKQAQQQKYHDVHSKVRVFEVGQSGLARNYYGSEKWCHGRIVARTGPISYRIEMGNGVIWRRHADQIVTTGEKVDMEV